MVQEKKEEADNFEDPLKKICSLGEQKEMNNKKCFLSIVISTLGRVAEICRLLDSILVTAINVSYEVLIVDQNENGLLDEVFENYKARLPLMRYVVQFKGLSKARNFGIIHANGDIICFPDDDAEFQKDTVDIALSTLSDTKAKCVFGKVVSRETGEDVIAKFSKEEKYLSLKNFEGCFVEAAMFADARLLNEYLYDENMGVGTIYGSQEGYDLVYRLLQDNISIYYSPKIKLYHPNKILEKRTKGEIKRAFYYSCGFAYLCRKHMFIKKYKLRMYKLSLVLPVIFIVKHKEFKYYMAQWMGLKLGYGYL